MKASFKQNDRYESSVLEQVVISAPSPPLATDPAAVSNSASVSPDLTGWTVKRRRRTLRDGSAPSQQRKGNPKAGEGNRSNSSTLTPVTVATAANRHFAQSRGVFEVLMDDSEEKTKCEAIDTDDLVPQPSMVSSLRNHLSSPGATERGETPQDSLLPQRDIDIDMEIWMNFQFTVAQIWRSAITVPAVTTGATTLINILRNSRLKKFA
ncbi:unnamed protein product [Peronospora destructor]|uniref:Uncharacterized protein n=1 Tax=Peronospora destructor TaxID=86335 RepID=A0AAV0V7C0_9STRA|nr:unnamed protein product [Peronospora destructor]